MNAELPFRLTGRAASLRDTARALLDSHGLKAWEFGFNTNVRRAGVCFYPCGGEPGRIELSVHFAARNTDEEIHDTLLHRNRSRGVVGTLVTGMTRCGKPSAARSSALARKRVGGDDVEMPRTTDGVQLCPTCATEYDRHRKPTRMNGWFCRPCGPNAGKLRWEEEESDR